MRFHLGGWQGQVAGALLRGSLAEQQLGKPPDPEIPKHFAAAPLADRPRARSRPDAAAHHPWATRLVPMPLTHRPGATFLVPTPLVHPRAESGGTVRTDAASLLPSGDSFRSNAAAQSPWCDFSRPDAAGPPSLGDCLHPDARTPHTCSSTATAAGRRAWPHGQYLTSMARPPAAAPLPFRGVQRAWGWVAAAVFDQYSTSI